MALLCPPKEIVSENVNMMHCPSMITSWLKSLFLSTPVIMDIYPDVQLEDEVVDAVDAVDELVVELVYELVVVVDGPAVTSGMKMSSFGLAQPNGNWPGLNPL